MGIDVVTQVPKASADAPSLATGSSPPAASASPISSRHEWEGFAAREMEHVQLAAYGFGPLNVYGTSSATAPRMTLEEETILGTPTVLGVVGQPRGDRVEVVLPVRPNGTTGWVDLDDVGLYVVDGLIRVDLSERQLTYEVDGVEMLRTEVGIGSVYNETPTGTFFVTDRVTLANPSSPWGPHALGLSARSDSITEYNGGDGIIGIHGTNNPSSIGGNISLGCVRLPNDVITELHSMVPIGTPVVIDP